MPDYNFPSPETGVNDVKPEESPEETAPIETSEPTEEPEDSDAQSPVPPDSNPRPARAINDTRGINDPVLGHFVDVVEGEHKGAYGVFYSIDNDGETAVVRTRDANTDLLTVPVSAMRPAEAGRR